ncbi:MAG TPA: peptidoglycan-binding protein, partial [Actinomycetota bacterium]|nr:peptidoglycan-binding protein [Actinomycetota bacterium]
MRRSIGEHVYRHGDRSAEIVDIQTRLREFGLQIDDEAGHFGASTTAAVREFQQRRGILVDGIVGPHTWSEIVEASWHLGDRDLYLRNPMMRGDDISDLQTRLNALGFDSGKVDGIFGPATDRAVRAFQKEYGVAGDGIFGLMSHAALVGLRVDRPGTAATLREELRRIQKSGLADQTIVIDPGHGGADRGETTEAGVSESDACWRIATRVADRLASFGATVRFTRNEPENPDHSTRAKFANEVDADLFISIHLNSHEEPSAEGCSTYYFGGSPAGETVADQIQTELVTLGLRD